MKPADNTKKQSFLEGAAVLTIATILVKLIGACFKIPLNRMIGKVGYGHFMVAYDIYNVLLTVATAGLPIAVSRMISESVALGNTRQVGRIQQVSMRIFLLLGIVGTGIMLFGSRALAGFMNDPDSYWAILALSPAVLMVCVISSLRGYFQGQSYMTPTAISQVIESLCKLFLGLGFVALCLWTGKSSGEAAGAAILGITIGTVLSMFYLLTKYMQRAHMRKLGEAMSFGQTAKTLLRYAIPITIGASGLQIFNALDSKIILGRLLHALQLPQETATGLYGLYSAAQTLYMLPSALVQPLAVSIIPSVTAALTLKKWKQARRLEESAVKLTAMISMPCAAGFLILAKPVQALLYGYGETDLAAAGPMLQILGVAVVCNCLVVVTNAILQAHGRVMLPIFTTLCGGTVNVLTDYFLIANPKIGINGAAVATVAYCAVIMALNFYFLHQHPKKTRPRVLFMLVRPLAATLGMSVATYLGYKGAFALTKSMSLSCLLAVLIAVAVYAFLVLKLQIITWGDCMLMPKGEKLAKLLRVRKPAPRQLPE